MVPSKNAIDLIKKFEGCKLEAYEDLGGVWTIGWGTTGPGIVEGLKISQNTADAMLVGHVREIGLSLTDLVGRDLNQNHFDSLTCFAYNLGMPALRKSTLLKKVKAKDLKGAAEEFLKWDHVGGRQVAGLTRRREAEQKLFLS